MKGLGGNECKCTPDATRSDPGLKIQVSPLFLRCSFSIQFVGAESGDQFFDTSILPLSCRLVTLWVLCSLRRVLPPLLLVLLVVKILTVAVLVTIVWCPPFGIK